MSTERKLLRSIVAMETQATPPHLPTLMTGLGVSPTEFREVLTQLFRKGYVNTDWQTTAAGKRVARRPLGRVLLRRQPKSHASKSRTSQNQNSKNHSQHAAALRKVFASSQPRLPSPLSDAILKSLDATHKTAQVHTQCSLSSVGLPAPILETPRTPPPLAPDEGHAFEVRESELEELKPQYHQ